MISTAVKVDHINPFLKATIGAFDAMLKTEAIPGKLFRGKWNELNYNLTANITLSEGVEGNIIFGFPKVTALKAVSVMAEEKIVIMDTVVMDAIGELANIIAAKAKNNLSENRVKLSVPKVLLNTALIENKKVIPLVVPFDSNLGKFHLIICIPHGR
jgi:CheY-specific phosphatase CheX